MLEKRSVGSIGRRSLLLMGFSSYDCLMADAQQEEKTQQLTKILANLQCRIDKLMQGRLRNRQRPKRGGGEGWPLTDLPCTEMQQPFFFPDLGKKYFSSATRIPATTTTGAGMLPLVVVEAGTWVQRGWEAPAPPAKMVVVTTEVEDEWGAPKGRSSWTLGAWWVFPQGSTEKQALPHHCG